MFTRVHRKRSYLLNHTTPATSLISTAIVPDATDVSVVSSAPFEQVNAAVVSDHVIPVPADASTASISQRGRIRKKPAKLR